MTNELDAQRPIDVAHEYGLDARTMTSDEVTMSERYTELRETATLATERTTAQDEDDVLASVQ